MDKSRIKHFKEKLEKEKELLISELKTVANVNPSNPDDWEAKGSTEDSDHADRNVVADEIGNFENNIAILRNLEVRFGEVKNALAKIEAGKYGICEVSGELIEEDRLEANPAATTCKTHMGGHN